MGIRGEQTSYNRGATGIRLNPTAEMQATERRSLVICHTADSSPEKVHPPTSLSFYSFSLLQMRSCRVAQAGLELVILLPPVQSAAVRGVDHHLYIAVVFIQQEAYFYLLMKETAQISNQAAVTPDTPQKLLITLFVPQ